MQIESGYIKHDGKSIVFKILVNSNIIGSSCLAEGLRCVIHELIHNIDGIKMLRIDGQI